MMTQKQSEHFLRTLIEMAAKHHGCEATNITFVPKEKPVSEEQRQES